MSCIATIADMTGRQKLHLDAVALPHTAYFLQCLQNVHRKCKADSQLLIACLMQGQWQIHANPHKIGHDASADVVQADGEEGKQTCEDLGIEVIPTVQFWRGETFLWEHRGYLQLDQDLGDGMAYTDSQPSRVIHSLLHDPIRMVMHPP